MLLRPVLMPILRNPLQGIADGIRNMLAELLGSSQFFAPLTHSLVLARGTGSPTYTNTTANRTFTDWEGVLRTVPSGCARFEGGRMVRNLLSGSENIGSWVGSATVTTGVSDPDGGTSAFTITTVGGGTEKYLDSSVASGVAVSIGAQLLNSVYIRRRAGTGTILMYNGGDGSLYTDITASLTSSWQRISTPKTAALVSVAFCRIGFYLVTAGDAIDVWHPQTEDVTGQADQTASEYVSVGVVQRNVLLYSNTFNLWGVVSNVTVTANQLANPINGAVDAWKVAATAAAATNLNTPFGITASTASATVSFYVHKGSGATDANKFALYNDSTASILSLVSIDYDTGVLTTLVGAAGASSDIGSGWWRITLSATSGVSVGNQLRTYACFSGNAETAGEYAYLYGAQGEFNPAATEYQAVGGTYPYHGAGADGVEFFDTDRSGNPIPDATLDGYLSDASVPPDVLAYQTASNIAAAANTVYVEFTPQHAPSGTIALWGTYVDASNYTAILHDATNMIMRKRIAGTNYDATIANAFVSGTTYKVAGSWGAAGVTITVDGVEGTPDADTTAAQIGTAMEVGGDGNSLQQPGAGMANARAWQRQLSGPERIAATA